MEIAHIPGRVLMLFEYDHFVRNIFTDGRQHPSDLSPSWMGDAIGKWEGDTLVVDTVGFNDKTWLDNDGLPHSEDLHVVERIRRVNHDTLDDRHYDRRPQGLPQTLDRPRHLRIEADMEYWRSGLRGQRNLRRHAAKVGRIEVAQALLPVRFL